jgi:cob(I)alamin adenosyltransferase
MVRITRVYTGGGDDGSSSLVDGSRRRKSDQRFEVVGCCDELNAVLGIVAMEINRLPQHEDGGGSNAIHRVQLVVSSALKRIQNEMFDIGAELACDPQKIPQNMALIGQQQSDILVDEMDAWLLDLEPLSSFILPTGEGPIAILHLARTVTRRLERAMVRLIDCEGEDAVRNTTLIYINRFSDWLFIMSRWISKTLVGEETMWQPLGKRGTESGISEMLNKMRQNDSHFDDI